MPTTFFLFIFTLTPFFWELWKVCFAALFGFFQSKKLLSMNIHCSNIFIEVFLQRKREKKNICLFSKYWTDLLSYYDAVKIRLKKQDINCFFPFFLSFSLSVNVYFCLSLCLSYPISWKLICPSNVSMTSFYFFK